MWCVIRFVLLHMVELTNAASHDSLNLKFLFIMKYHEIEGSMGIDIRPYAMVTHQRPNVLVLDCSERNTA